MAFNVIYATFVIFIIFQDIPMGSAIMCYQCEEDIGVGENMGCHDLVASVVLIENCTTYFTCIKYIQTERDISRIHRSCGPRSKCEELKADAAAGNIVLKSCDTCNTTFCNSGEMLSFSILLTVISFSYTVFNNLFCEM